jgi:hypothetical protein
VFGDGRSAFLVRDAVVQDLPHQAAEPVGDRSDRLGVSESGTSRRCTTAKIVPLAFRAELAKMMNLV